MKLYRNNLGKHANGWTRPKDYTKKVKVRRRMEKVSRRRNRA